MHKKQLIDMITMSHNRIQMVAVSKVVRTLPRPLCRLALAGLTAALMAGAVQAADIPLPNGSFESPAVPSGFPALPQIDNWQDAPEPPGYDPANFGGLTWDQLTGVFSNTAEGSPDHIVNLDGAQAAYMFAAPGIALSQELGAAYEIGLSYTLTVGLLGSQGIAEGSTIELSLYYLDGLNAPVTVASAPVTYTIAGFPDGVTEMVDFSVNLAEVQAGDAWAGQNIGIQFLTTAGTVGLWDLDNVRLQAIPEPGTMALLAIGALGLAGSRIRRSR